MEETFVGPTVMFRVPTRSIPSHIPRSHVIEIEGATHYDIMFNATFLDACVASIQSLLLPVVDES